MILQIMYVSENFRKISSYDFFFLRDALSECWFFCKAEKVSDPGLG